MTDASSGYLIGLLLFLIVLSALFSSSETAMMSLNKFRLKHLRKNNNNAERAAQLLERPDRLISLILIGNNAVNILAALVAGILFTRWLGEAAGVWATTATLTVIMLIFAEITPKTLAAIHPEKIAFPMSRLIQILMFLFSWLVSLINWITNAIVRSLGVDPTKLNDEHLSSDELRTVVDEAGKLIPDKNQGMLLGILDLDKITVNDIMIPRNEIAGLDLLQPIEGLISKIVNSHHTRLPIYEGDIDNILGTLHLRKINRVIQNGVEKVTPEAIKRFSREPYFIPENTPLSTQLVNFQNEKRRVGYIVDEYGDIQGLATIDDLLEEIVGNYTTSQQHEELLIKKLGVEEYCFEGNASIRDINKETGWNLPVNGPKTINGLALEVLETLPDGAVSFVIQDQFLMETQEMGNKVIERIKARRIRPSSTQPG